MVSTFIDYKEDNMTGSPRKKARQSSVDATQRSHLAIQNDKTDEDLKQKEENSRKVVRIKDENLEYDISGGTRSSPPKKATSRTARKLILTHKSAVDTVSEQAARDVKHNDVVGNIDTPVRRSRNRRSKKSHTAPQLPVDPVIEQWYTDPYNRHDPEGPAETALRKQNLTNALRNRGFRGPRIVNIVNWIVRCNGRYKEYDELVGNKRRVGGKIVRSRYSSTKRGTGRPQKQQLGNKSFEDRITPAGSIQDNNPASAGHDTKENDSDVTITGDTPSCPSPMSTRGYAGKTFQEASNTSSGELETPSRIRSLFATSTEADGDSDNASDDASSIDEEEAAAIEALNQELKFAVRTRAFKTTHLPGTQAYADAYDDWLLENLRRTKDFWDIIYGDDLDVPGAEQNAERAKFTYFRDPAAVPRVDVQYRTQGLKPVKRMMHKGKELMTEDENFGLCDPGK